MNYMEAVGDTVLLKSNENQPLKWDRQQKAFLALEDSLKNTEVETLKWHKESGYGKCIWSYVETFRYLSTLYEVRSDFFQRLNQDRFQAIQREFYENQPILLTLPFKKKA